MSGTLVTFFLSSTLQQTILFSFSRSGICSPFTFSSMLFFFFVTFVLSLSFVYDRALSLELSCFQLLPLIHLVSFLPKRTSSQPTYTSLLRLKKQASFIYIKYQKTISMIFLTVRFLRFQNFYIDFETSIFQDLWLITFWDFDFFEYQKSNQNAKN